MRDDASLKYKALKWIMHHASHTIAFWLDKSPDQAAATPTNCCCFVDRPCHGRLYIKMKGRLKLHRTGTWILNRFLPMTTQFYAALAFKQLATFVDIFSHIWQTQGSAYEYVMGKDGKNLESKVVSLFGTPKVSEIQSFNRMHKWMEFRPITIQSNHCTLHCTHSLVFLFSFYSVLYLR